MFSKMNILVLSIVIFALIQGLNCKPKFSEEAEFIEEVEEVEEGKNSPNFAWILQRFMKIIAQFIHLIKDVTADQELAKKFAELGTPASPPPSVLKAVKN